MCRRPQDEDPKERPQDPASRVRGFRDYGLNSLGLACPAKVPEPEKAVADVPGGATLLWDAVTGGLVCFSLLRAFGSECQELGQQLFASQGLAPTS